MKLRINNFEELIITLICIAGEVDEEYLFERLPSSILNPYDYTYAKRTLHRMAGDKLINKKEYRGSRKKYLRLSKVRGDDAAQKISGEMMPHFYLLAGDENNRYKGASATLLRKRCQSLLTLSHILDGIPVDNLMLDTEKGKDAESTFNDSIFTENGKLKHPKEIIEHLDPAGIHYLTSNALRGASKASGIFKGNSRYSGVLVACPKVYICYFIAYAKSTWTMAEEQIKLLTSIYASSIKEGMDESPAAIMYFPDGEVMSAFLNYHEEEKRERGHSRQLNPREVYASAYFLPLSENYSQIREFLLMDGGEEKLNKVALENAYTPGKEYDGMVSGCKIYNLLLMDFCKISRIRSKVRDEDSIIVIHRWAEEMMRVYFGDETRIITVEKNEFTEYLEAAYSI